MSRKNPPRSGTAQGKKGRPPRTTARDFAAFKGRFLPRDPDDDFLTDWNKLVRRPPQRLYSLLCQSMPNDFVIESSFWRSEELTLDFTAKNRDGNELFSARRSFDFPEKTVTHNRFVVSSHAHGRGLARVFLRNSMKLYQAMGIEKVEVTAAMTAGGYTWARFGFKPDQDDWDRLREKLQRTVANLSDEELQPRKKRKVEAILRNQKPEAIWLIADLTYKIDDGTLGKYLLRGESWSGSLDLKDRRQMRRFWSYVGKAPADLRKGLKTGRTPRVPDRHAQIRLPLWPEPVSPTDSDWIELEAPCSYVRPQPPKGGAPRP